jgi:hypothetical protein
MVWRADGAVHSIVIFHGARSTVIGAAPGAADVITGYGNFSNQNFHCR